jgi:hypothetical protein
LIARSAPALATLEGRRMIRVPFFQGPYAEQIHESDDREGLAGRMLMPVDAQAHPCPEAGAADHAVYWLSRHEGKDVYRFSAKG